MASFLLLLVALAPFSVIADPNLLGSDNYARVDPACWTSMLDADSDGFQPAYGTDALSRKQMRDIAGLFPCLPTCAPHAFCDPDQSHRRVAFTATGTAANVLVLGETGE